MNSLSVWQFALSMGLVGARWRFGAIGVWKLVSRARSWWDWMKSDVALKLRV